MAQLSIVRGSRGYETEVPYLELMLPGQPATPTRDPWAWEAAYVFGWPRATLRDKLWAALDHLRRLAQGPRDA